MPAATSTMTASATSHAPSACCAGGCGRRVSRRRAAPAAHRPAPAAAPARAPNSSPHADAEQHREASPTRRAPVSNRIGRPRTSGGIAAGLRAPRRRSRRRAPRRAARAATFSASSRLAMRQRPRAEREPHAHFALPRAGAREHEVGGVAAHREQQQQHDDLQDRERGAPSSAAGRAATARTAAPRLRSSRLVCGIRLRELAHRRVDARSAPARAVAPARAGPITVVAAHAAVLELARAGQHDGRQRRRQPEVELQPHHGALEAARRRRRRSSGRTPLTRIVLAERRRATAEARLPVVVRDHDDRGAARRARLRPRAGSARAPGCRPSAEK